MRDQGDYAAIVQAASRILTCREGFMTEETTNAANDFLAGEFQAWQNEAYGPAGAADDPGSSDVEDEHEDEPAA